MSSQARFPTGDVEVLMKALGPSTLAIDLCALDGDRRYLAMDAGGHAPLESTGPANRDALLEENFISLGLVPRERARRFQHYDRPAFQSLRYVVQQLRWLWSSQPALVSLDPLDRLALIGACRTIAAHSGRRVSWPALAVMTQDLVECRRRQGISQQTYDDLAAVLRTANVGEITALLFDADLRFATPARQAVPASARPTGSCL